MQDAYDESLPINPADVSPELTKHFRGLRLWFPLKMYGYEVFADGLREKLLLTVYFRQRLEEIGFKLGPEPDLSVSYFWFPHKDEDAFNRRLLHHIHRDGRVFLSSSIIQGRFVIRMAILAFRTKRKTIDVAMNMITKALDRTRLEMEL
jgi:glutamate/tyrosine decarboxylase-like PLP-dependent enzyme